jgi:glyoxylase-like metal-dependent hydrolase (beta-lactamase superfamily II)
MEILSETVGVFAENTYFLVHPPTRETVLVDPGDEAPRLLAVIEGRGLLVRRIVLTHGHLDHVGAAAELQAATGAPVHMHRADELFIAGLAGQAALFGLSPPEPPRIDGYLAEGDAFRFGGDEVLVRILETPGHSPGSITLAVDGALISGDVLFAGSIGRTDLPGGDYETLMRSIRERLREFPGETRVYPGHGPPTTLGAERRTNPFLTGAAGGFSDF